MAQCGVRLLEGRTVLREDGAGERVVTGLVHELQRLFPLVVVVHIGRDDGAEDLLAHQAVLRIRRLDERRLHEPTRRAIGRAAGDHLGVLLGIGEVAADAVEGALVDHRAHEVREVVRVADLDLVDHRRDAVADFRPDALGHVDARAG